MRILLLFIFTAFLLLSCKKDKYTTTPQIKFLSLSPNYWTSDNPQTNGPILKFSLTDAEGDFGFQDTSISYVYIRNVNDTLNSPDSLAFPNLPIIDKKNLSVEVEVNINNALPPPHTPRPFIDTLYFEVYVKDFANNKSNVIRTAQPFYFETP